MFGIRDRKPWGLKWRSSVWFTTLVVGVGLGVDLMAYAIVVPVFPFRLQELGYPEVSVSASVGWLLFAYSAGLVLFSVPVALLSEKYKKRQTPLILGFLALIGSQILLMLAPTYWLLCFGRVIQGMSSAVVWVVGFALLADVTPEQHLGKQLGLASMGISVGTVVAPPIGGLLYSRFGYMSPFIFGVIVTLLDLIGRLLIIERKDALKWGYDPVEETKAREPDAQVNNTVGGERKTTQDETPHSAANDAEKKLSMDEVATISPTIPLKSTASVYKYLLTSGRSLTALAIAFVYGVIYSGVDTILPLRMQSIYGFDAEKVGIILLASVLPDLLGSPSAGWLCDKVGSEWVVCSALFFGTPWWIAVAFRYPLVTFIPIFVFQFFFTSSVMAPVTVELAEVARGTPGIGYGHTYGLLNAAFGSGSAVGPLVFGQIYANSASGWLISNLISAGLLAVLLCFTFYFSGDRPLAKRFIHHIKKTDTPS